MSKGANLNENQIIFLVMTFPYLLDIDSHVNELKEQLNENSQDKTSSG